jgi:sugar-specific transcriptional regulator TrmB
MRVENRNEGNLKGCGCISRECVLKTLAGLGFSQVEAEIYLFLSQTGPEKGRDIAETLKLYKQQLYRSLKSLRCKGCVEATLERPARFSAVPLEKVLDFIMKTKMDQAEGLQASRDELLSSWRSIIKMNSSKSSVITKTSAES